MTEYTYVGQELDLFSKATNWKSYVRTMVDPYLGEEVLEVGAGIGGTTRLLCQRKHKRWVCLEPDPSLSSQLVRSEPMGQLPTKCDVVTGTLEDVLHDQKFDSIIYMDVLEHIEGDQDEMRRASTRLKLGGHLVVLSPAHQFLFTDFDKSIGHFRRYSRETLAATSSSDLHLERLIYMDSVGMIASMANRIILKQSMPTRQQIALWDGVFVRMSRILDPLLFHSVGKSVLGVWTKG